MSKTATILCASLALFVADTATATTAEDVVARHIEARGGRQAWDQVESIRLSGEFTGFSKINPFVLVRKRDRLYHLDHTLGDKHVTVGYDGETRWWDNHWFQQGAQKITEGADLAVLERDLDFVTPLFEIEERGYELSLLDQDDLDGEPVIALELKRPDDSTETWYLDPETYLEHARESPASDFGRPMTQRTYFDDFRQVGDVTLPHYVETQWYTRHRVMEVADVELNVEIDDELFSMPAPPGMKDLLAITGDWTVKVESRQSPQAPWSESSRESTIVAAMGGSLVRETFETADGNAVERTLSFDRHRKHWVLAGIDARSGLLDIQTGIANDDGSVTLSNVETGTTTETFGFVIHSRTTLFPLVDGTFRIEGESSIDGGENWFVSNKVHYERSSG